MNLLEMFGSRVAYASMPNPHAASIIMCEYAHLCDDFDCGASNLFECLFVFECFDYYQCYYYFTCLNHGGGDDFTCTQQYTVGPHCSSPIPSIPC